MSAPLDFFRYRNSRLFCEEVDLAEIAARVGTPTYVYSSAAFLDPLKKLQQGLRPLRDFMICYAVKSNPSLAILKLLAKAGAGADLVSGGELFRALTAGVSPEKIVFSGVGKTADEIRVGLSSGEKGIYSFHVESLEELELIQSVAKKMGKQKARVAFRFNPNIDPKTHPYISTGLKRNKFGLNRDELLEALRRAKRMDRINVCGLSIHIGSQLLSLTPLKSAFKSVAKMIPEAESILGVPLEFVDLGGGVGVSYKISGESSPSLSKYSSLVVQEFGLKSSFRSRLRVLIEPGRTISANAGILLTRVLFRKPRKSKDFLVIDAGMNDLIRPALYQSHHEIIPVHKSPKKGRSRLTDLVGPVCESSDCFGQDLPLSPNLHSGDLLAILSSGA
ncbi:MAG: diaminopimelate decarboxylase, partial [Bdellovibrionales bacterium]|nr:diaminopimelate decarboxylase [Bdellovibrionales bacterium]